jgi:hypothetical protein
LENFVQAPATYREAGNKFGEHDEPDGSVGEFEKGVSLEERGYNQENDGHQIEYHKAVPKANGTPEAHPVVPG